MDSDFKKIDEAFKAEILADPALHKFLEPEIPNESERASFIKRCLKKLTARRMLLLAQWYIELADHQSKVRESRPALNIIFLIAMSEAVAKMKTRNSKLGSLRTIQTFFRHILRQDKEHLQRTLQRSLSSTKHHALRFSSIIRIFYGVRNEAVHGGNFWDFSLWEGPKPQPKANVIMHYGLLTFATMTSRSRKTKSKIALELRLSYSELRDIFRRTAIENVKSLLN